MAHLLHYYQDAPLKNRLICKYRELICPSRPILEHLSASDSVLDIGCGVGLMLMLAAEHGLMKTGHGIDLSQSAITTAQNASGKAKLKHGGHPDLYFDACADPKDWPESTYDTVLMIDVMHHIPPDQQAGFFAAAVTRVKPGGRMIYKDMCKRPLWRATANRLHDLALARQWIHYRPMARIHEWAVDNGLEPAYERTYNKLWYGHQLLVLTKHA